MPRCFVPAAAEALGRAIASAPGISASVVLSPALGAGHRTRSGSRSVSRDLRGASGWRVDARLGFRRRRERSGSCREDVVTTADRRARDPGGGRPAPLWSAPRDLTRGTGTPLDSVCRAFDIEWPIYEPTQARLRQVAGRKQDLVISRYESPAGAFPVPMPLSKLPLLRGTDYVVCRAANGRLLVPVLSKTRFASCRRTCAVAGPGADSGVHASVRSRRSLATTLPPYTASRGERALPRPSAWWRPKKFRRRFIRGSTPAVKRIATASGPGGQQSSSAARMARRRSSHVESDEPRRRLWRDARLRGLSAAEATSSPLSGRWRSRAYAVADCGCDDSGFHADRGFRNRNPPSESSRIPISINRNPQPRLAILEYEVTVNGSFATGSGPSRILAIERGGGPWSGWRAPWARARAWAADGPSAGLFCAADYSAVAYKS